MHRTYTNNDALFFWKSTLGSQYLYLLIWPHYPRQSSPAQAPEPPTPPLFEYPRTLHLPPYKAQGNEKLGSFCSSCQRLERAGELLLASTISPGSTFSHRNNDPNGSWLPSAKGLIVQPYSGLNRLLWTGLGTFSPFVTLFPWEKPLLEFQTTDLQTNFWNKNALVGWGSL